ncbi:MAG: 3-isopropylmalate dehydratase large subunit [Muribaculaceae bacterium]|nr:3-isopropylmalate dehydratase large subunit [Muribaculaceae bacterium]
MGKTLLDKVWDSHVVKKIPGGLDQLYIDRHFCHEVTSPQAFDGLRKRGINVFRPEKTVCAPDHNIPTLNQDQPIAEPSSRIPVETLYKNAEEFGLEIFPIGSERNGIIHVIGPEQGLTLPGMTIVCGDSHTSTHGALGAIAFGIGTSEIEMVLATQCIMQPKPKSMRININGKLKEGVTAKDVALFLISKLGTGGATGYFIEYAGEVVRDLSMEGRMTLCNLSIEMGARGGMIAPDATTYDYISKRPLWKSIQDKDKLIDYWKTLPSDPDAVFDREISFDAAEIEPRITFGTNPGMGIGISENVPQAPADAISRKSYLKALEYMKFNEGQSLQGYPVDYVFLGSCTNGRIEDFRQFASLAKGRKKNAGVVAWLVPGSRAVLSQIKEEGLDKILEEAGFEIREPGCSACLAMNEDKVPAGKLCVSTTNRNFEGRQGPGARTILAGPLVAAAAALTGEITDPRKLMNDERKI